MNEAILRQFSADYYESVVLLNEETHSFEDVVALCPHFPKGWYELSRLSAEERIEFIREYWSVVLPYLPHVDEVIDHFFLSLEDVGIYLTRDHASAPCVASMVYCMRAEGSYFQGGVPAEPESLITLEQDVTHRLPDDFIAFSKLHDSFKKAGDSGVIPISGLSESYADFQTTLSGKDPLKQGSEEVNPRSLIPFYQSYGMDSYQCFHADWYPQAEMGNVYYSGIEHRLSDLSSQHKWKEELAFPTFLDWFATYIESGLYGSAG